jgi:hypothetical protein
MGTLYAQVPAKDIFRIFFYKILNILVEMVNNGPWQAVPSAMSGRAAYGNCTSSNYNEIKKLIPVT